MSSRAWRTITATALPAERSRQIRRYVAALRERAEGFDSPERERILQWCEWAADWAEGSDPTRCTELIVGIDERDEFGVLLGLAR